MEPIIRKIQKALRLASNNPSAEEAQSAALLAQRLMTKHGLKMADVSQADIDQNEVQAGAGQIIRKRIEWWQRRLNAIIANNFRCYGFFTSGRNIGFLGLPEDVEVAIEVYQFAENAVRYNASEYLKESFKYDPSPNRRYTNAVRNDYITGFLDGLKTKFKEQVELKCLALVLVRHEVVEQAHKDAGWKSAKPLQRSSANDSEALAKGYQDGRDWNNPSGKMIEPIKN